MLDTIIERITLATTRLPRWLSILAPSTNLKARYKTKAFITRLNKPKVKKLIGNDKNFRIGVTIFCNIVNTTAVRTRADGLSNEICEIKLLISHKARAFATNKTIKSPFFFCYYYIILKNKGKIVKF